MDTIKLLIVDPNIFFTRSARHYLGNLAGVENIETTGDLAEGLKMARESKPDYLLIDDTFFKAEADTLYNELMGLKNECPGLEIIKLTLYEESTRPGSLPDRQFPCRIIAKENFAQNLARELQ